MNTKKFMKNVKAVSPVIATLMLVIVAVAAAAGFYVWQTSWQETLTGDVETVTDGILDDIYEDAEGTELLTFSGSTTLGPMIEDAIPLFEAAFPNIDAEVISQPGSSAGISNVYAGTCDIGMASKGLSSSEEGDGLVANTVAYDGVVIVWTSDVTPIFSDDISTGSPTFTWDFTVNGVTPQILSDCLNATYVNDANTGLPTFYYRGDGSGTEEVFCKQMLDSDKKKFPELIDDVGFAYGGNMATIGSNTEMANLISSGSNAWGFLSFGHALEVGITNIATEDLAGTPIVPSESTIADLSYFGARPLNLVTVGAPSVGTAEYDFITWIQAATNNADIMHPWGFVSLYD